LGGEGTDRWLDWADPVRDPSLTNPGPPLVLTVPLHREQAPGILRTLIRNAPADAHQPLVEFLGISPVPIRL